MRPLPPKVFGENVLRPVPGQQLMVGLVVFLAICVILYFGREIIIPVVLAVLLSLLLAPGVRALQRWSIPKSLAISMVVGLTLVLLLAGAAMIATALTRLAADLPQYETNLREKAKTLRVFTSGGGTMEKAANVLKDLQIELADKPAVATPQSAEQKPILVEMRDSSFGPLEPIISVLGILAFPVAQLGIVIIMVFFILFNREDLRNRFLRLAGTSDIHRTTIAIDEAVRRLSKLFTTQLMINVLTGAFIGTALTLIGVPGGILWGALTAVLRFVPYIGTLMSSVVPLIIAAAVGDGWTLAIATIAVVLTTELIVGQVLEPLFFGKSSGLSPVAVVAAATFWTALWGPIGLVLATPLTIAVLVVGRHIEQLQFLEVMLGSEPVLTPDHVFYQRMLAGDPLEAAEQAHEDEKAGTLGTFLTDVAVPALLLAQHDQRRGVLTKENQTAIAHTFSETLDEIWDEQPETAAAPKVTLIAGNGALNFAAALAFSAYLTDMGIAHRLLPEDAIQPGKLHDVPDAPDAALCLCYLSVPSEAQHAYLKRRILAQAGQGKFYTMSWSGSSEHEHILSAPEAAARFPMPPKPAAEEAAAAQPEAISAA
ncbi:AI-2E family transporter [Aestuariivirga sp.]|uniref:AI-2E family transporter n=1 Tax=Aestuariivirga sp. TaxID=2650926 RepID=UPI0039E657D0